MEHKPLRFFLSFCDTFLFILLTPVLHILLNTRLIGILRVVKPSSITSRQPDLMFTCQSHVRSRCVNAFRYELVIDSTRSGNSVSIFTIVIHVLTLPTDSYA